MSTLFARPRFDCHQVFFRVSMNLLFCAFRNTVYGLRFSYIVIL
ncbi:hypothetical protein BCVP_CDS0211 [Bacillus phage BC-VP]|nr:hypothetical protein BCVP_CDS0211 [Bacillus phage BC-VP]